MNKEPCKVLVVDSNRDHADTTVILLRLWGHEAEAAYEDEDAIFRTKTFDPDVILLDLGRPTSNGFDLAGELRLRCPEAKLVAITDFTSRDIVRRTREAGFEKVLLKPTPASVLQKAVENECTDQHVAASETSVQD